MADVLDVPEQRAAQAEFPRILGDIGGELRGPTLVCVGGLHGNEPSGVHGLQRVIRKLEADRTGLQGRILALTGNRKGLAADERYLAHDLNRAWTPERLARVHADEDAVTDEDAELLELETLIAEAIDQAPGYAALFDLHSTSGGGAPFVTMDDTLANRALAFKVPAPHVLGLEEELAGTMLGYWIERGVPAVGFESGQHQDPGSVDRAEAATWIVLETSGVVARGSRPEMDNARQLLRRTAEGLPEVVEVRYREPVVNGQPFRMRPGYVSFQRVRSGEVLADNGNHEITSPENGMILMPLYQKQGEDGFFIIRSVRPFWLRISALLRHMRVDRFVHWLPGVKRHPKLPGAFLVDRRRARWFALEVFHLLGFRRAAKTREHLVVTPREPRRRKRLTT
ncbi:MAG: succinylglutamate desuccinylase/aspartoacylase family protein [Planctomycetota bacterium]|nr:succinylglutamate desuccinylase/aspartoacylase family protein [Planctomycetota bacterium]